MNWQMGAVLSDSWDFAEDWTDSWDSTFNPNRLAISKKLTAVYRRETRFFQRAQTSSLEPTNLDSLVLFYVMQQNYVFSFFIFKQKTRPSQMNRPLAQKVLLWTQASFFLFLVDFCT